MKPETKEKIRLTAKEILLNFFDGFAKMQTIFGYQWQRDDAKRYLQLRKKDKNNYYKKLWQLEKQGYLKRYKKDEKAVIKLTPIGRKKVLKYLTSELKIIKPKKWDRKWRIVIFDIPKDKKLLRDVVRLKIKQLGFCQLQKSVFVYPFDCKEIIAYLKYVYSLSRYLQYIVAESIETENNLISYFYDKGVLRDNS